MKSLWPTFQFPSLLLLTTLVSISVCRQMCYSCNYVGNSLNQGYECVTAPRNWTFGNWRLRCNTLCTTQATHNKESGKTTFMARGCSASVEVLDNYCDEGDYEVRCFFTCQDHYCNDGPGIDDKYLSVIAKDGATGLGGSVVVCVLVVVQLVLHVKRCL